MDSTALAAPQARSLWVDLETDRQSNLISVVNEIGHGTLRNGLKMTAAGRSA